MIIYQNNERNILVDISSYTQISEIELDILKVTQISQYSVVYLEVF